MNSVPHSLLLAPVNRALQINMYPLDVEHVIHCLPHQLRTFADQVDRIHLTVDLRAVTAGRYRGEAFDQTSKKLITYLKTIQRENPKVEVDIVDYSQEAHALVSQLFFKDSAHPYPSKAFDGGPFHVYFWGIAKANAEYVLHMDSDMLFGGQSQNWLSEAIELFEREENALFIAPLGGPPRLDLDISPPKHSRFPGLQDIPSPRLVSSDPLTIAHDSVSTRLFLINMTRFKQQVGSLPLLVPNLKRRLRAFAFAQNPQSMPAEEVLSHLLMSKRFTRLDFLGSGNGMFSLHPTYRSPEFYHELPSLIARIEAGDIPLAQRGDHDLNASMHDWSSALKQRTMMKRYRKAIKHLISANLNRWRTRG